MPLYMVVLFLNAESNSRISLRKQSKGDLGQPERDGGEEYSNFSTGSWFPE